jgi:hypothetical protein
MEHLYNTIRPVGKRAIVAINSNDKQSHTITDVNGKTVELFVDTSYSWDGKVSKSTQGILLTDFKNLKAGTHVLIHHNAISDDNKLDIEPDIHTSIHAIEDYMLHFGVIDGNIVCVEGFMVAERLYEEHESQIVTEKKKKESMLRILAKADNIKDFEVNDIAVVYKYSDYEMTHNVGGKMTKLIRLKYSDCLGKVE